MLIPEIRSALQIKAANMRETADMLEEQARFLREDADHIDDYAAELHRRSSTRAARTSARMTPALKEKILAYAAKPPYATQAAMAKRFNVNIGRISETLNGKRK